jgi:hypothetical protein
MSQVPGNLHGNPPGDGRHSVIVTTCDARRPALQKLTNLELRNRPRLGSAWTDLLVVVGCCLVFATVVGVAKRMMHEPPGGIVRDLGPMPEQLVRVAALGLPLDLRQQ